MPVDMSVGNSIVNAFALGRAEAQRKEERKTAAEQALNELKEKQRQFDAVQKYTTALKDIQVQQERQKLLKETVDTGINPAGFDRTYVPTMSEGISSTGIPEFKFGVGTETFTPQDEANPIGQFSVNREAINKYRTNLLQEQEEARITPRTIKALAEIEARGKEQQEMGDLITKRQKELQEARLASLKEFQELTNQTRRYAADMQYKGRIEAAKIRASMVGQSRVNRPLSTVELEMFLPTNPHLTPQSTRADVKNVPGMKPRPDQDIKLRGYDNIEDTVGEIKELLPGISNEKTFKGPIAGWLEQMRFAATKKEDPTVNKIRTKLGNLQAIISVGEFGKSLTAREKEILNKFLIDSLNQETPMSFYNKLDELLNNTQRLRGDLLHEMGSRQVPRGGVRETNKQTEKPKQTATEPKVIDRTNVVWDPTTRTMIEIKKFEIKK